MEIVLHVLADRNLIYTTIAPIQKNMLGMPIVVPASFTNSPILIVIILIMLINISDLDSLPSLILI
jgi:hypothetical protein